MWDLCRVVGLALYLRNQAVTRTCRPSSRLSTQEGKETWKSLEWSGRRQTELSVRRCSSKWSDLAHAILVGCKRNPPNAADDIVISRPRGDQRKITSNTSRRQDGASNASSSLKLSRSMSQDREMEMEGTKTTRDVISNPH